MRYFSSGKCDCENIEGDEGAEILQAQQRREQQQEALIGRNSGSKPDRREQQQWPAGCMACPTAHRCL
jgi:hypothetical protein